MFFSIKNVAIGILVISFIVMVILYAKTKKPFRSLFLSSVLGIAAFVVVNLISGKTGFSLGYNYFTAGTTIILGLPGVALMIIMKLIMHV